MIKRALALFFFFASPLQAVPVEVTSGEHEGFTRVVLNFGVQTDWQFGRTIDGYRFRPIGKSGEYDLRPVFDKIGKSRLAAISENPETSELDIGFACACHAIPFEFRPGIIVIDLRDGPPPKGSSFEEPLPDVVDDLEDAVAGPMPDDNQDSVQSGTSTYNWLDKFTKNSSDPKSEVASRADLAPKPSTSPDLQPLRDQLLRQLSRGASEGVIDLAIPGADQPMPPKADVDAARVVLGELGGVTSKTARTPNLPNGAEGTACIASEHLDFSTWAKEEALSVQLSSDMTALVGEFDTPSPEAVTRAAKTRLYFSFGLEARQILQAFPATAEDEAVLMGLSYLVDGEADPTLVFRGQGTCATAAALWAALSDPDITQAQQVDSKAVILAFSNLPQQLRTFLGPILVDRLLELKDEETASTLRNIVLRAKSEPTAETAVMEAKIELARGDPAAAEHHLEDAATNVSMTSADALIARVKAISAQGLPIDKDTVTALEALQSEMQDSELGPKIDIAIIHAKASSGDFEGAFAALPAFPAEAATVWQTLASLADDSRLLTYAIAPPNETVAGLLPETTNRIAQRLLDLGLPDNALKWMETGGVAQGQLLSKIHLARRDGASALQALGTDSSPDAEVLRAQALTLLGDHSAAAQSFAPVSETDAAKSLARAQDWQSLASAAPSEWTNLAQKVTEARPPTNQGVDTFGPLARGLALADQSAATRSEIEKLLSDLPVPALWNNSCRLGVGEKTSINF